MGSRKPNSGSFKKGQKPWNTGTKGVMKAWNKGTKGVMKANSGSWNKGRSPFKGQTKETNPTIMKRSITATGKIRTKKSRKTMSVSRKKLLKEYPQIAEKFKETQFKKDNIPHNAGKKASEEDIEKNRLGHLGQVPFNKDVPRNQWMSPEGEAVVRKAQLNAKSKGPTDIELIMKKTLDELDITYLQYANKLPGRPDFFIEPNICIFCDGDWDHANPNLTYANGKTKYLPDTLIHGRTPAREIWEKDERITKELKQQGFTVSRFWGFDINKNLDYCIEEILKAIKKSKR